MFPPLAMCFPMDLCLAAVVLLLLMLLYGAFYPKRQFRLWKRRERRGFPVVEKPPRDEKGKPSSDNSKSV